ncbi:MAG: hypothetical protein B7Y39_06735 [Bdellovibrio sp. 28-41-41]|nr:MAG: hypothetical protein B7Y39_06735 [Bdellovibrio sp. 28-41-41]
MKKILIPLFAFVLIATGVLVFRHQNLRQPSSVKMDSNGAIQLIENDLSRNENKKQIKRALLQSLDWNYSAENAGLSLKFENVKFSNGSEADDLCTTYPNMAITLEAPDISYSGEHPEIHIQKACEATGNIVPFETDLSLLTDSTILKDVKAQSAAIDAQIRVANWDDDTPDKWRVKQLIFYSASKMQNQNFEITKYEILSVLGYSVEFQITAKKQ